MKKVLLLSFVFTLGVVTFAQDKPLAVKTGVADFGGTKVFYQETGKGKNALVFIHGWTCNSNFWKRSIHAFPEYRVVAIDLPGHGQSDKPQTNYTMEYFAKSIAAVMADAGIKRAILVGHSMGTPVVRQFYRLYPQMTIGLGFVDGALRPFAPKAQMEVMMAPMFADFKKNGPTFMEGMLQSVNDNSIKKEVRDSMSATPDYVAVSAMKAMMDEKIWTEDKINVPSIAILADNPFWPKDTEDYYRHLAPGIDYRMWQGVSHFLMMEQPQLFNKSLKLWISKNKLMQ